MFSGPILLFSLYWGLGGRCDEACTGENWQRTTDAWQWNLVPTIGLGTFVAGTAFLVYLWRKPWRALTWLGAGTVILLAAGSWTDPGWTPRARSSSGHVGVCAIVFFSGVIAALLAAPVERG